MSWQDRIPDGVDDLELNVDGFTAKMPVPPGEDGFVGRARLGCESPFKIHTDTLLNDGTLCCPYCGHRDEASGFMTDSERERAEAAVIEIGQQYAYDMVTHILGCAPTSTPSTAPACSSASPSTR